jgi:hypothetical protein
MATQFVMQAVHYSDQDIPEGSERWISLLLNTLTRIAKRYDSIRKNKPNSRAPTPMSPVMVQTPSVVPTLTQRGGSATTSPPTAARMVEEPFTRSSPTLDRARAGLDEPQRWDESDELYRRRRAAFNRLQARETSSVPVYTANNDAGEAPNTDNRVTYPNVTVRMPRATIWKDRVAYQRLRREDINRHGSSQIDDQGVRFRGPYAFDAGDPEGSDDEEPIQTKIEEVNDLPVRSPSPTPRNDNREERQADYPDERWDDYRGERRTNNREERRKYGTRDHTSKSSVRFSMEQRESEALNLDKTPTSARHFSRGYSTPRSLGPRQDAPGVVEASDRHRSLMEQRLATLIHEALSVRISYPDGVKFNIKIDVGDKYTGSSKFADLENWLSDLVYKLAVRQLGGKELDRLRVIYLGEHLGGEAHEWFIRHVLSVSCTKLGWTFEDVIIALYNRFIHATTKQDAREGFRKAKYSASRGVQAYYDELIGFATNMAAYPDDFSFIEVFLEGIPKDMRTELLRERGLSPEAHTMEDFIAFAIAYESRVKTDDYYHRRARVHTPPSNVKPSETTTDRRRLSMHKTHRRANHTSPKEDNPPQPPVAKAPPKDNPSQEAPRNRTWKKASGSGNTLSCFNCGGEGHFSRDCPQPPKNKRVHVRAAHSEDASSDNEGVAAGDNDDADSCASDCEACAEDHDEGETFTDIEVEGYQSEDSSDFMRAMTVTPADDGPAPTITMDKSIPAGHDRVSAVNPSATKEEILMRRVRVRTSNNSRVRPVVSSEDKECLATYLKVGGMDAWVLWDSGSTTTGITPTFVHITDIVVDTLLDPHILQLGTVGSRSIIKYGADVLVDIFGKVSTIYVDIANFDRYDMIVGTPFMRQHKVILNFITNKVIIDGRPLPATRVQLKDTDGRLRRYRASEKVKE